MVVIIALVLLGFACCVTICYTKKNKNKKTMCPNNDPENEQLQPVDKGEEDYCDTTCRNIPNPHANGGTDYDTTCTDGCDSIRIHNDPEKEELQPVDKGEEDYCDATCRNIPNPHANGGTDYDTTCTDGCDSIRIHNDPEKEDYEQLQPVDKGEEDYCDAMCQNVAYLYANGGTDYNTTDGCDSIRIPEDFLVWYESAL